LRCSPEAPCPDGRICCQWNGFSFCSPPHGNCPEGFG
jgi:hypothetical protein